MRTLGFLLAVTLAVFYSARSEAQPLNPSQTSTPLSTNLDYDTHLNLDPAKNGLWDNGVGNGYRRGAMEFEGTLGAGFGLRLGGGATHDIALTELRFGRVVSKPMGKDRWYGGNLELMVEAFAGTQWHPDVRYFSGIAPVLRYNFITGTRWVPFVDASAGVVFTGIGLPDLGEKFNFDLQAGPGLKYYFRDNMSCLIQYRYLHFSDGGLSPHNKGVNVNTILLGVSLGL